MNKETPIHEIDVIAQFVDTTLSFRLVIACAFDSSELQL